MMDFQLKGDSSSLLSSNKELDWAKVQDIVQRILDKRFSGENPSKKRIKIHSDEFQFACPYCGDSHSNGYQKRGHLYFSSATYHCFNNKCHAKLEKFIEDFNETSELNFSDIVAARKLYTVSEKHKKVTNEDFLLSDEEINKWCPTIDEVVDSLKLMYPSIKIKSWLIARHQEIDNKFWMDSDWNLVILNIRLNKVLGYQTRSFKKYTTSKYLTTKLSGIREKMGLSIPDDDIFQYLNDAGSIYGYLDIDFSKVITCFEGPLDSFLVPNSVALSSAHKDLSVDYGTWRFCFDNDETGRKKAIEWSQKMYPIFLWKKVVEHFKIPYKEIPKDFNDLIIWCRLNKKKITSIDEFFSTNKFDIFWL